MCLAEQGIFSTDDLLDTLEMQTNPQGALSVLKYLHKKHPDHRLLRMFIRHINKHGTFLVEPKDMKKELEVILK